MSSRGIWRRRAIVYRHARQQRELGFLAGQITATRRCTSASCWAIRPRCAAGTEFDLDPLGGSHVVHGSIDYRYRFFQVFYDTGAVWDRVAEREQKQSVGVGFKKEGFQLAVAFPAARGPRRSDLLRRNEFLDGNYLNLGNTSCETIKSWWLVAGVPLRLRAGDGGRGVDPQLARQPAGVFRCRTCIFWEASRWSCCTMPRRCRSIFR